MPDFSEIAPSCYGSEDEKGNPTCDGPDVKFVTVKRYGAVFTTQWCADCRQLAVANGYEIVG